MCTSFGCALGWLKTAAAHGAVFAASDAVQHKPNKPRHEFVECRLCKETLQSTGCLVGAGCLQRSHCTKVAMNSDFITGSSCSSGTDRTCMSVQSGTTTVAKSNGSLFSHDAPVLFDFFFFFSFSATITNPTPEMKYFLYLLDANGSIMFSLKAASSVLSTSSSAAFQGNQQHVLPAFITITRKLMEFFFFFLLKRLSENPLKNLCSLLRWISVQYPFHWYSV